MSKNNYVIEKKRNPFFTLIKVVVIIAISISMVGLENSIKTDNLCFANVIGLDKSETLPSNLLVTFQLVAPKMESSNSVSVDKTLVTSIDENSLELAISNLQDYISANIDFANANALIISDELAKDGVQRYVAAISSNLDINNSMYILVCEGKAKDFIETLDKNKDVSHLGYFDILENSEKKSGATKVVNLTEFSNLLFTTYATPYAPLCKIDATEDKEEEIKSSTSDNKNDSSQSSNLESSSDSKSASDSSSKDTTSVDSTDSSNKKDISQKSQMNIEISGLAIFKDEKLIGTLTTDETPFHLMLTSQLKSYNTTLDIGDDKAPNNQTSSANVNITQTGKAKIKVDTKGSKPRIDIKIPIDIVVLDTPAGEYDYLDSNYINNVKKKVQEVLDRKMDEYIYKLQKEYNVDLAELYRYSRKNFLTAQEYNKYNFKEKFKDAKINVKLDITFNDSGLNLEK